MGSGMEGLYGEDCLKGLEVCEFCSEVVVMKVREGNEGIGILDRDSYVGCGYF